MWFENSSTSIAGVGGDNAKALALKKTPPSIETWACITSYAPRGLAVAVAVMQSAAVAGALQKQHAMFGVESTLALAHWAWASDKEETS